MRVNGSLITQKKNNLGNRESKIAFLFILPPILGLVIFTLWPLILSVIYSFSDYNPLLDSMSFVGWTNYVNLFTHDTYSASFFTSIFNTVFLLIALPIRLIIAIILAALINSKFIKCKKFFKIVYYLPAVSSVVAISVIFRYIFNGEYGLLNYLLGVEIFWTGTNPWLIKVAIIIKDIWAGLGFTMIMYLAGMLGVSKDYYEAADLDGANELKKFLHITAPMLGPITLYLVMIGMIGGLQSYADAQVFANGATGAQTIVYFIWQRGIDQLRYGLASAASLLLAVVIIILSYFQLKRNNKWIDEV